ncbi:MBOAT family O-acyltransferase [Planctomicrobium sp. SH661]|uniref:MBOAT family O-acyltransferase n=1 Tax=Planctomicrobium sp. SH661 TaxID=3448124 RepID=UPI003F5C5E3A
MLFNSFTFWLFYATVFVLYFRLGRRNQNLLLLVASYYFYGCWDWRFLGLIALSTLIDFSLGLAIDAAKTPLNKKRLVTLSIIGNLCFLGFFKYFGFFSAELERMLTSVGMPGMVPTWSFILPVGISFYTFQSMSYTIDVYRGDLKPCRSILDFAAFVSFFPQLVAGPIQRASAFLPQFMSPRVVTPDMFKQGLYLVASGMFRKIVVADNMAPIADAVFSTPVSELTGAEILLGLYAFAFQIYGDFSGYSDIARGIANWLGFDLSLNFRMPYLASSPSDFWQRWHISLSRWLRDYLYIPLGGNRGGNLLTYRNLLATMLLGGLWHGANWTFLAWGAFHGMLLCIWRFFSGLRVSTPEARAGEENSKPARSTLSVGNLIRIAFFFNLICFSWLLFRADSMTQVWAMTSRMCTDFTVTPFATMIFGLLVFYVTPLMLFEAWLEWKKDLLGLLNVHWAVRGLVYLYIVYMIMFFPPPVPSEFIYFQF